jgi:hypothetical protein
MTQEPATSKVLQAIRDYLDRFLILSDDQRVAVSAWVAMTYIYEAYDTVPYLIVTSAEKRSGKTRVIECVQSICANPIVVTGLTEAVLFRVMERKPTLLIDETDTIFAQGKQLSERQEALRAILNAGYRRGTMVYRCAPNGDLLPFPVYGPKVLAGIGHLPDTIEDRGLCIRLKRKLDTETVERFRYRVSETEGAPIRKMLDSWSAGKIIEMANVYPDMPDELDDRSQDAYEVLVAIGDLAGARWSKRVRSALVKLRLSETTVKESIGMRLLRDLALVVPKIEHLPKIATVELLDWLYREGENEWDDWWGETTGRKAARRLAMTLGEYDVAPMQWNAGGDRGRGYAVPDLMLAVRRYVTEDEGSFRQNESSNGTQPSVDAGSLPLLDSFWEKGGPPDPATASMDELREWYRDP